MKGRDPGRFALRPELRRFWLLTPGSWRGYMLLAAITFGEGAALLIGGRARATAPSWRVVYALGGPESFGAALAVLGLVMLVAPMISVRMLRLAMMLSAMFHLLLAFTFAGSAIADPRASWLSIVIWGGIGLHLLSHREAYREVK